MVVDKLLVDVEEYRFVDDDNNLNSELITVEAQSLKEIFCSAFCNIDELMSQHLVITKISL